jgi:hypothetical protein
MSKLMLSILAGVAEFERQLSASASLRASPLPGERAYTRGRKGALTVDQVNTIRQRADQGERKAMLDPLLQDKLVMFRLKVPELFGHGRCRFIFLPPHLPSTK